MKAKMKAVLGGSLFAAVMLLPAVSHAAEVDARLNNQMVRINQGYRMGQIGPGEAARLRGQAYQVRRELRFMRMRNGGVLRPDQRARINWQENQLDRRIFNLRHR